MHRLIMISMHEILPFPSSGAVGFPPRVTGSVSSNPRTRTVISFRNPTEAAVWLVRTRRKGNVLRLRVKQSSALWFVRLPAGCRTNCHFTVFISSFSCSSALSSQSVASWFQGYFNRFLWAEVSISRSSSADLLYKETRSVESSRQRNANRAGAVLVSWTKTPVLPAVCLHRPPDSSAESFGEFRNRRVRPLSITTPCGILYACTGTLP